MPKKHWIYLKRGFVIDPKHREAVGETVWLYFYILDRANWEDGKVYDWKDQAAADEMCLDRRTIIRQRTHLEKVGYIKCERGQHGQTIIIKKWVSPRSYSGETVNLDVTPETHLEEPQNPDVTPDVTPDVHDQAGENALFIKSKIIDSPAAKKRGNPEMYKLAFALSEVCEMNFEINSGRLFKEAKLLSKATPPPTPELLKQHYNGNKSGYWRSRDWRGKLGQAPTPSTIRETWGKWGREEPEEELHHV